MVPVVTNLCERNVPILRYSAAIVSPIAVAIETGMEGDPTRTLVRSSIMGRLPVVVSRPDHNVRDKMLAYHSLPSVVASLREVARAKPVRS